MDTSPAGSALPLLAPGGRRHSARDRATSMTAIRLRMLLTGPSRVARRLFDRIGMGLRTFDDNLWDGGDGT